MLKVDPKGYVLGRIRAKSVQYALAVVFGEVHLPHIFKMIVVEVGLDQRGKWLGRIYCSDRDPRLNASRNRDLRPIVGARGLNCVEMLENRAMVQADPHAAVCRKANRLKSGRIQLGLDFERDLRSHGWRLDHCKNGVAPTVATEDNVGMAIQHPCDPSHHHFQELCQMVLVKQGEAGEICEQHRTKLPAWLSLDLVDFGNTELRPLLGNRDYAALAS